MPVKLSNLDTLPLLVSLCMDTRHALAEGGFMKSFHQRQVLFTMEQKPNTILSAEIENLII